MPEIYACRIDIANNLYIFPRLDASEAYRYLTLVSITVFPRLFSPFSPHIAFLHLYGHLYDSNTRKQEFSYEISTFRMRITCACVCRCVCVPAAGVTIVFAFARERHMRPVVVRTHAHTHTHA